MHVVPTLLQDILIVIAFFWKPDRLPTLILQLNSFMRYTTFTNITIVITTNKPANLINALNLYMIDCSKIEICDSKLSKKNSFDLTFEHRLVIEEKLKTKHYTAYMYTEDDHMITPQGLVSWAIDTELLEPLGFVRGFVRSEYCGERQQHLFDYAFAPKDISLTKGRPKVDSSYKRTTSGINFESNLQHISSKYGGSELCPSTGEQGGNIYTPCPIHTQFFSPEYFHQGMWLLSHIQLIAFMRDKMWNINYCKTYKHSLYNWGSRERAASYNLLINIPPGFQHNKVIPYYNINNKHILSRLGVLYHLSGNYCHFNNNRDRSYIYDSNHNYTTSIHSDKGEG